VIKRRESVRYEGDGKGEERKEKERVRNRKCNAGKELGV
jgi:hypothetical protein